MSKQQWIGLAIVLLMVAAVEVTVHLTKKWREAQTVPELLTFQPEREQEFEQYLDSLREAEYAARKAEYAKQYAKPIVHLQPFDPNTADSALLVTVGLQPWMAKNLIRYRAAGKVFRQPEDLRSLYGMNDTLYATLKPYIQIDTAKWHDSSGVSRDSVRVERIVKRDTILELNTADTAELQLLRGVGRYTAVQIVRYRQALGGYHSVSQLYEIKELPKDRVDSIVAHLFADASQITPIAVNRASVKQLQRHPYISYKQAEQIYDLRRRKIQLHSIDELSGLFTDDEQQRLTPYLQFSDK
jgi:DNA uptake protein ComE-like DNA-binding protein